MKYLYVMLLIVSQLNCLALAEVNAGNKNVVLKDDDDDSVDTDDDMIFVCTEDGCKYVWIIK